jgi:hypothetical protein
MNIYDSLFSSSAMLNEQLARIIFEFTGPDGPFITILGPDELCRTNNESVFEQIFADKLFLGRICANIDDGNDPLVVPVDGYTIIAAQLIAEDVNCGYLIVALENSGRDDQLPHPGLVELLVNQFTAIAELAAKNNRLHHLQLKQLCPGTEG